MMVNIDLCPVVTRYKGNALETERKLKLQNFLPTVNLQANLLSKDYYQFKEMSPYYLENNYKLGVHVKVPLLWRQSRGEYRTVLLKIRDNKLEQDKKLWELQNKIRKYYNEAIQLLGQLQAVGEMNKAYDFLLRNEELKFLQGESSLFLINARQNKTLEMQQKIIELQVKYQKAAYAIQW
jgi:outer membrane protein TolC